MKKIFCPCCGHKLEKKRLENRERSFCQTCQAPVYENPLPATAVVVFNPEHEVLLVLRGQEPGKGKWCLPGGFMEIDENPGQCALRELAEETGLGARLERFVGLEMSPNPMYGAVLVMGFQATAGSEQLKAGDDAQAAAYFSLQKLPELAFASHARIIAKAAASAGIAQPAVDLHLPWGAYVITSGDHLQLAREACRSGARIIQYREKDALTARRLDTARQIRAVTREHGTLFIVNDQLDIAMLSEADGVHLGQEDIAIADARSLLAPGMIIGISCSSLEQARAAEDQGADYLGIGAVFATPVKVDYSIVGLTGLRRIAAEISIPLVAIGGINLDNMAEVKEAGIMNVAMVREFQTDTAARVAAVNSFFN